MIQTINYSLWWEGEYSYPEAYGFMPNVKGYLHEENEVKYPCILIVPGGGYRVVSPTEGEIVAKKFYQMGYNAFVCTYTTNLLGITPLKMQPLRDISRAVRFIRKHAEEFHIAEDQIVICGFSAGGHLAGSLCVHCEDIEEENEAYQNLSNRPDAAILCYPVITSGECAHYDSFLALLGENATKEDMNYMSLEKQVSEKTPPCFLWQTKTDELVPVENSRLMEEALKKAGVSCEYHVFSHGRHGLSLADDTWASGDYGFPYTMEQVDRIIKEVKSDRIKLPDEIKDMLLQAFDYSAGKENQPIEYNKANQEVMVWPELADSWIKRELHIIVFPLADRRSRFL